MTTPRRRRTTLLVALLVLAVGCVASAAVDAEPVRIKATPVPLNPEDPGQITVGNIEFRGGLALSSEDTRFGGFSALGVSADGRRMIALSDKGARFGARLVYDESGNLAGLRNTDLGALSGVDGRSLTGGDDADIESMSPGVEGEIIVAFERQHRLMRYAPGAVVPEPLPAPEELAGAPSNGGIEALTLLDDGRLLAITEMYGTLDASVGWVSDQGGWSVLTYHMQPGFRPTGAATLPGGDIVVVERLFTFRGSEAARLVRLDQTSVEPGARLKTTVIAEIRPPLTVDNFEGVEARLGDGGETLIYVISDDNFRDTQRTLLLMFALMK